MNNLNKNLIENMEDQDNKKIVLYNGKIISGIDISGERVTGKVIKILRKTRFVMIEIEGDFDRTENKKILAFDSIECSSLEKVERVDAIE